MARQTETLSSDESDEVSDLLSRDDDEGYEVFDIQPDFLHEGKSYFAYLCWGGGPNGGFLTSEPLTENPNQHFLKWEQRSIFQPVVVSPMNGMMISFRENRFGDMFKIYIDVDA